MDKEKMNARELTERELEMVSGGTTHDVSIRAGASARKIAEVAKLADMDISPTTTPTPTPTPTTLTENQDIVVVFNPLQGR